MASKKSKRLSRRELKEKDQVLTGLEKGWHLLETHAYKVLAILIGGVVVTGIWALYGHCSYQSEADASRRLNKAIATYNKPVVPETPDEGEANEKKKEPSTFSSEQARAKAALKRFKKFLSTHSDSELAPTAEFYAANCLYQLGRYDKAIKRYERFLSGQAAGGCSGAEGPRSKALEAVALENLAYSHESTESYDKALEYFAKLEEAVGGLKKEWAIYHQARIWEKKGDVKKAISMYRKVKVSAAHAAMSPLRSMAERRASYLETGLGAVAPRQDEEQGEEGGETEKQPEKAEEKPREGRESGQKEPPATGAGRPAGGEEARPRKQPARPAAPEGARPAARPEGRPSSP